MKRRNNKGMFSVVDHSGKRYGKLTVLERAGKKGRYAAWKCACDCGNVTVVRSSHLTDGSTLSCGCLIKSILMTSGFKHGHASESRGASRKSRTYQTWENMRQRCYRPETNRFGRYGGRGIQVCARWFDFSNFLSDMGERPIGMTLDRINNDGHYMPSNCRWATYKQQAATRSKPK